MTSRTSLTHPLAIAELPVGTNGGAIGVTFAPGKHQEIAMTGAWARDLDMDLAAIRTWGARYLITLIEPWEFVELGISSLPDHAAKHGLIWHGLPITDGNAPDQRFLAGWKELGPFLSRALVDGGRVVLHCKGGLGRAGLVASLLLLSTKTNSDAESAMLAVRRVRPGAVETVEQECFIHKWAVEQTA